MPPLATRSSGAPVSEECGIDGLQTYMPIRDYHRRESEQQEILAIGDGAHRKSCDHQPLFLARLQRFNWELARASCENYTQAVRRFDFGRLRKMRMVWALCRKFFAGRSACGLFERLICVAVEGGSLDRFTRKPTRGSRPVGP